MKKKTTKKKSTSVAKAKRTPQQRAQVAAKAAARGTAARKSRTAVRTRGAAKRAAVSKAGAGKPAGADKPAARGTAARSSVARKSMTVAAKRRTAAKKLSEKARLARNKRLVLKFYDLAINQKDFAAASKYMAPRYIQHNPAAADGHEGLAAYIDWFKRDFPNLKAEVKRVIAEGDFVVLHVHGTNGPDPHGTAVIDVFRVEDGKVAEHWDVIQAIPAEIANPNGMF